MDISIYFEPIPDDLLTGNEITSSRFADHLIVHNTREGFPDTSMFDIAVFGVADDRASVANAGTALACNEVRKQWYALFPGAWQSRIADLGNIRAGHTIEDTYYALSSTVSYLIGNRILPVVIGGGHDLTYAIYQAYEQLEQIVNMAVVDPRFDLGETHDEINSHTYLSRIIMRKPNFLFNFTNLGYQTYYIDQQALELMKKLFFDCYRLGSLTANLKSAEPLLRNADFLSFDISAVRAADAPGHAQASPNGFTGEQACQLVRYAAMSDKLSCIGIFEYNPAYDNRALTAQLLAQMIWYAIDGYNSRKADFPQAGNNDFIRYIVPTNDFSDGIVFLKSRKTDRWWMEVKCESENREKYAGHYIVPCMYEDYKTACNNEIPDRWWQVYQKLM
ncbi:MAG: formimidoylglutamase [Lentimicrobiaceae bacterium]|nr:formimidoylglutamase [Lentimicrobiaceae bacterium]